MVKEGLNYWDARTKLMRQQNEQSLSATYNSNFSPLPRYLLQQTHIMTTASDLQPTNRGNASEITTGGPTMYSQGNPHSSQQNVVVFKPNEDAVTISTTKFVAFVTEVIKNTLLSFGSGKSIDIESIIANSIGSDPDMSGLLASPADGTVSQNNNDNAEENQDMESSPIDLSLDEDKRSKLIPGNKKNINGP